MAEVLSFELCEILKNTYFVEDLQTTASEYFVGFTFFVMKILVIFTKQSKIFIILANNMGCLSEPYLFNFFRGCLLQNLLGTFLNTLDHIHYIVENSGNFVKVFGKWHFWLLTQPNSKHIFTHCTSWRMF